MSDMPDNHDLARELWESMQHLPPSKGRSIEEQGPEFGTIYYGEFVHFGAGVRHYGMVCGPLRVAKERQVERVQGSKPFVPLKPITSRAKSGRSHRCRALELPEGVLEKPCFILLGFPNLLVGRNTLQTVFDRRRILPPEYIERAKAILQSIK
jgi:hypothetical protein